MREIARSARALNCDCFAQDLDPRLD